MRLECVRIRARMQSLRSAYFNPDSSYTYKCRTFTGKGDVTPPRPLEEGQDIDGRYWHYGCQWLPPVLPIAVPLVIVVVILRDKDVVFFQQSREVLTDLRPDVQERDHDAEHPQEAEGRLNRLRQNGAAAGDRGAPGRHRRRGRSPAQPSAQRPPRARHQEPPAQRRHRPSLPGPGRVSRLSRDSS